MSGNAQPVKAVLPTVFDVVLSSPCVVTIKNSENEVLHTTEGAVSGPVHYVEENAQPSQDFTIEVSGEGVKQETHNATSEHGPDFTYAVNASITVKTEYFVDVYVAEIPEAECYNGHVTLVDANSSATLAEQVPLVECRAKIMLGTEKVSGVSHIKVVTEIEHYRVEDKTFEVHAETGDIVEVAAFAYVEPTHALVRVGCMVVVFFNNTVDKHTFAYSESFAVVNAAGEEARAVDI